MTCDEFLAIAWSDHAERPQEVADRLAASLHLVQAPEQIAPFASLVAHVWGEHLGQWQRGIEQLQTLGSLSAWDGSAAVVAPVARHIAALRYAGGDASALEPLPAPERVSALASAAAALAGRGEFKRAIAAYAEALQGADAGLPAASPAIRALAIGGNNLAAALEEKTDRDAAETRGMVAAARGGLRYWRQAGTWLEEERAEYRLARSLLQAGEATAAMASAARCVEVCAANDAPAFERFFGHAVLAIAERAAGDSAAFEASREHALAWLAQVPADEQQWCAADARELRGDFKTA